MFFSNVLNLFFPVLGTRTHVHAYSVAIIAIYIWGLYFGLGPGPVSSPVTYFLLGEEQVASGQGSQK